MDRAPESFPAAAHLAALVESSQDAILSKALDGTIMTWNAGAERLYGYRAEEVVGKPFSVLLPPDHAAEADAIMARLRCGEPVPHFETVRVRKDGTRLDVSVSYSPIRDEARRLVGAAVIARDVTERRRAERALREVEARFAAIIDHSPSCIFAKDAQGRYLLANRALAEFAGRDVSEFPGRTDGDFFPPEVAAQFARDDAAILAGGQARTFEEQFPHGGGTVTALTVKFPLLDANGRPYAVCGIATDITGQRRAQEELNKFALLVENSHDFIAICDREGRAAYVNRAGLALVGLGPEQMPRTHLREYFFPEDRPFLFEQFFPRVLREGHGEVEVRFRHFQTGEALWMVYSVLALKGADGRPGGAGDDQPQRQRAQAGRARPALPGRRQRHAGGAGGLREHAAEGRRPGRARLRRLLRRGPGRARRHAAARGGGPRGRRQAPAGRGAAPQLPAPPERGARPLRGAAQRRDGHDGGDPRRPA
jgi:PAS domain S-box-containing protein